MEWRATYEVEPHVMRTERLALRACTGADGAFLAQLYADPDVARFVGGDRLTPRAAQQQADKFSSVWDAHGYGQSILLDHVDGRPVGRVGLHPWPEWGELELGWVLARRSQGQGLASEAARAWLDWARRSRVASYLTAVIHPDNAASIRLAERLGFTFDRTDQTPWSPAVIYRHDLRDTR
jgi:RimJ/RimL family protein N-acetyltransferase